MTEYVTPNIHTVLKKYQTSAPKSLQGPGHSLNSSASGSNSAVAANQQQTLVVSSLQLQQNNAQSINNNNTNNTNFPCPLDVSLNNGLNNGSQVTSMVQDMHGLVTMRNSPCDLIKTGHCPINTQAAASAHAAPHANLPTLPSTATTLPAATASALSLSSASTTLNINPALPLIKKEIMTSPEPIAPQHDLPLEVPLLTSSIQVAPPVQAAIKIMPPPPPEVSQPILSSADSGSGELYETRLEGKTIGCFSLGGEMRLCLPQFLNNVLAEFSLEQINRSFDDLGIFCSQCTPDQLLEFKAAKILPNDVKSSGLITRTDAERLCAILLHRSDRNSYINVEDIPKGAITFKVYHRCFGKCEGICTPDMYSYQKPTCIMCLECKGWFSPQKFVGHVHRKVENRTCHWGFDSRNWHDYLHVALDVENRVKYQKILDELKEVEIKEQIKAQQEINYLKRKAELHMDHSILVPSMGLGPPPPPPHQPLPPSVKHRGGGGAGGGDQHDIPSTKKSKSLDEASAYQLEYQHYQSLMYAHCAQQQRMAAAGQMSAFRPWPQPKTFMHAAYNAAAVAALSTLPYLSQEPPVLQNPERVVRSTDRERFERTYQPNVALAPRKTHLTQEREKEQRELRERERIEREREREMERIRERERSREREREYERERELREREMQKKLQQQQQQQQHQQQIHIKQQPITTMCEADIQIKQERPSTPAELPNTPPPPLSNHSAEADRRSNGPMDHVDEPHPTTPLISPLSLNRSKHLNHMELQTRRLSMHNSNSSAASSSSSTTSSISASSTTPTNLTNTSLTPPQQQHHQQPLIPAQKSIQQQQQPQHLPTAHLQRIPATHHGPIVQHGPQPYIRQSPSPQQQQQQQQQPHQQHHGHCNNVSCNNPSRSPEEFGGSNEITSSTSPLPTPQQQQQQQQNHHHQQQQQQQPLAQTIITTVNHHNKLMPTCGTFGANTNGAQPQQHNDMTGRIRISKNLINQNNIMRSPTPPPPAAATTQPPSSTQQQHPNHPQQQHPLQQQAGPQTQQQHTIMAAQNHQQQYDYYKQNQRFYQQQQHQQQQQQHSRNHTPQSPSNQQQQHQQHSPSQSSNTTNTPSGLNLTTALATTTAVATPAAPTSLQQNHDNGSSLKAHLRTPPQAFMNHQQHQPQQHHLQNGRHRSQVATNSEFELSTDTDDESVNDGEADSSNTLTPWELAIETLRDSRPKDRERLLQMLQRILNENQHYRLQNQQLNKLIEVRSEQINKLQIELQQCQRQLEQLQLNNPLTAAATTTLTTTTGLNAGNNGLITKALRKECPSSDEQSLILRVPLKKSQRREPEMYEREAREEQKAQQRECEESLQRQCDERIQYNLSQIKRELSESMEEDEEDEEEEETNTSSTTLTTEQRSLSDNNQQQVESSHQEQEQHLQRERANELASESEQEEEEEEEDDDNGEDEDGDQRMSSTQSPKRSHNEENLHKLQDIKDIKNEKDSLDSIENNQPQCNSNQQEEDDDDEEEEEEENREREENQVEAPHTNALETPPTATTPLSPDSAATAGQLFDSSNSSDESSMKKAQMSASNALAKMNSETNDDGEEEDEDEDTLTNNEESENEEEEQQEKETNENLHLSKSRHFVTDSLQPLEKALTSTTHSSPNIINTSINQLPQTPPNTTTVVLATKASKKLTPTTNNDIKIKQEYL